MRRVRESLVESRRLKSLDVVSPSTNNAAIEIGHDEGRRDARDGTADQIVCSDLDQIILTAGGVRQNIVHPHVYSATQCREVPECVAKLLFHRVSITHIDFFLAVEFLSSRHDASDFTEQPEQNWPQVIGGQPVGRFNLAYVFRREEWSGEEALSSFIPQGVLRQSRGSPQKPLSWKDRIQAIRSSTI